MLPNILISLKQSFGGVKPHSSPLLEAALGLGCVIRSVEPSVPSIIPPNSEIPWAAPYYLGARLPKGYRKNPLPCGHRFFHDCYREQEARFLDWLISLYSPECWFASFTFKRFIYEDRSIIRLNRWFSRLNQAYGVANAALLKSVSSVEWQQREVIHYHSLILGKGLGCLSRKRWESRWQEEGGGYCRIYEADKAAALYLVKHQIKDSPETALYLGGCWRDISPPKSLSRCCGMALNGSSSERISPSGVQCLSGEDTSLENKFQD